jgi:sorting and assembly machinery component 37
MFSWRSLIPSPPTARKQPKKTEEDIHYDRMRWGFIGLAVGSLAAYIVVVGGSRLLAIKAALEKAEGDEVANSD